MARRAQAEYIEKLYTQGQMEKQIVLFTTIGFLSGLLFAVGLVGLFLQETRSRVTKLQEHYELELQKADRACRSTPREEALPSLLTPSQRTVI